MIPKIVRFSVLLTRDTVLGDEQQQKESKQRVESSKVKAKHPCELLRATGENKQDTDF